MSAEQRAPPSEPIRLLLIDDSQDDYHLICDLLDAVPDVTFAIDWAKDLSSGRDLLDRAHADICLIDHRLPDGDGLDLLDAAAIREKPAPMIILAGHGSVALDRRAMTLGASGFLDKNRLDPALLERTIRYAMRHQAHSFALRDAALHDATTGLVTPILFRDRLTRALDVAKRQQTMVALVLIDLAGGRPSHERQEEYLARQAALLTCKLRKTDTVARLSDHQMALILEDLQSVDDATLVARKALMALATVPQGRVAAAPCASPRAGMAIYPEDRGDIDALLRLADQAMRRATTAPYPSDRFGSRQLRQNMTRRTLLNGDFERALRQRALSLRYRPLIHLADTRISLAAEIVLTERDRMELVSRDQLRSIAHDRPLIEALTGWCLNEAMTQLLTWQSQGLDRINLALPMISGRPADVPILERLIRRHLDEKPIAPEQLEIDLDQAILLDGLAEGAPWLAALKAIGIRLALDEFGHHDTSLHKITHGQLDSLKLSSKLYQDLPGAAASETLLKALINLGHDLDLCVVANGAHDECQFAFLKDVGFDAIKLCAADSLLTADMFATWINRPEASRTSARKAALAKEAGIAFRSHALLDEKRPDPAAIKMGSKTSFPYLDSP